MITTVGIRDLVRNVNMLQEYDYVRIEDKKTHEYKGIFVSSKHAREFEAYLLEKSNKQKADKLKRLKAYAGKIHIDEKYDGLSSAEIKKQVAAEKFGE